MSEQGTLFGTEVIGTDRDHALARFTDPVTSDLADAELRRREGPANVLRAGTHRHRALLCFAARAMIAEDVKIETGVDGIWKRVSDLKNMGFIKPTGETRLSREGREADILEITDAGRSALEKLDEERRTRDEEIWPSHGARPV